MSHYRVRSMTNDTSRLTYGSRSTCVVLIIYEFIHVVQNTRIDLVFFASGHICEHKNVALMHRVRKK